MGKFTRLQQQGTPFLDYDNCTGERCFSQTSRDIILHPVLYWCFGVITGSDAAPDSERRLQGYRETHAYPLGATCHCAPTPRRFRWHRHSCRFQNAQLFVIHAPFAAKRRTIVPHRPPVSPKTPSSDTPRPATLPPCSNPYPIRTILPSAPIPTRHPSPREPCQWPLPNTENLPPLNPLTCPPIPLQPPPKPFPRPPIKPHDPPNAIPKLAEMRGNEREIDLSILSPRNCKWVRVSTVGDRSVAIASTALCPRAAVCCTMASSLTGASQHWSLAT